MITTFTTNKNILLNDGQNTYNYFSVLTDIYLVVESNESNNYQDFKFIVEIYSGVSTLIRTYELVPNVGSQLITNLTPVFKDYLNKTPLLHAFQTANNVDFKLFRVVVKEYFDGSVKSTQFRDYHICSAKPRTFDDERSYMMLFVYINPQFILTKLNKIKVNLDANFLNYPYTAKFITLPARYVQYYLHGTNVQITLATSYNYKSVYMPTNQMEIEQLHLTRLIADNFSQQEIESVEKFYVSVGLEGQRPQTIEYIVDRCNDLIPICWLNEFGVFETFHFLDYTKETETAHTQYRRIQHYFDGQNYVQGGNVIVNATQTERMTLWTDWVSDENAEYLAKSIMQSKEVYIVKIEKYVSFYKYIPIKPIATTIKHNRHEYQDLVNVAITFETNIYDNL